MKILIINGPNLNMLGTREPEIYGTMTYKELVFNLKNYCKKLNIESKITQTNYEGKIIDLIQKSKEFNAIIINAGGYTHTSISIRDAISSIKIPVIEVHLSNINEREDFRKIDYIKDVCSNRFMGEGINSYYKAIEYIKGLTK